jgi:hypothetical protein
LRKQVKLHKLIEVPKNRFENIRVVGGVRRKVVLEGLVVHKAVVMGGEELFDIALVEEEEVHTSVYQVAALGMQPKK